MTIHYLNTKNEQKMLSNIIHLQNIDNDTWMATTKNGEELILLTERIEGIYYQDKELLKNDVL